MNKAKSQLILLADCICYIIALAAGTYLRFGADNAAGIFFYYSGGFYGLVLILSTISYIALFLLFSSNSSTLVLFIGLCNFIYISMAKVNINSAGI